MSLSTQVLLLAVAVSIAPTLFFIYRDEGDGCMFEACQDSVGQEEYDAGWKKLKTPQGSAASVTWMLYSGLSTLFKCQSTAVLSVAKITNKIMSG